MRLDDEKASILAPDPDPKEVADRLNRLSPGAGAEYLGARKKNNKLEKQEAAASPMSKEEKEAQEMKLELEKDKKLHDQAMIHGQEKKGDQADYSGR